MKGVGVSAEQLKFLVRLVLVSALLGLCTEAWLSVFWVTHP